MKKIKFGFSSKAILLFAFANCSVALFGQKYEPGSLKPKLYLDFPLLDLPQLSNAAQTEANHRTSGFAEFPADVTFTDYTKAHLLKNPSMSQTLTITSDIQKTLNYGVANLTYYIFKPEKSKTRNVLNRITSEFSSFGLSYWNLLPMWGTNIWGHEEFHHATLTNRGIYGENQAIVFGNQSPSGLLPVNRILDEDLIYFKKNFSAEHIRMSCAGTEHDLSFVRQFQTDNFIYDQRLPSLNLLVVTGAALNYINEIKKPDNWKEKDAKLDNINMDEPNIKDRDFTGYDHMAWVYDLHRPNEAYADRGVHTTGTGIDRYIKYSDWTPEMEAYGNKISKRTSMNYLSPALFGFSKIRINKNIAVNFAMRHFLTSFGDDRAIDLMVHYKKYKLIATPHLFENKNKIFPGLEVKLYDYPFKYWNQSFKVKQRIFLWTQPKGQKFETTESAFGGLWETRLELEKYSWFNPYIEISGKTNGWVAANQYLTSNFSTRIGFAMRF